METSAANETATATTPSRWKKFKTRMRDTLRSLPIVGHLANCTTKHHKDSLREFTITILFATATFWVTALFLMSFTANSELNYFALLEKTVSTGQLFIFAVGMLGPIVLASAEDPKDGQQFPGRTNHFAMIILLAALASGFYAFMLASKEPQAAGLLNSHFLFRASVVLAATVVVMRYITTVYRKSTTNFDTEEKLKKPVEDFATRFEDRHPVVETPLVPQAAAEEMINRFYGRGDRE